MNYTHLTREERYQIYALKKAGHKQREIAQVLMKRSESTISRELARNYGRRSYALEMPAQPFLQDSQHENVRQPQTN